MRGTAAAASSRQRRHLARRRLDVGGVGVGHRLDDDRRPAADCHGMSAAADAHAHGGAARRGTENGVKRGLSHRWLSTGGGKGVAWYLRRARQNVTHGGLLAADPVSNLRSWLGADGRVGRSNCGIGYSRPHAFVAVRRQIIPPTLGKARKGSLRRRVQIVTTGRVPR